jgi:hypothetical protein
VRQLKRLGKVVVRRSIVLLREIGLLVIAFTPIDAIIAHETTDPARETQIRADLGLAFKVGIGFVAASLFLEWLVGFWKDWVLKDDE